MAISTMSLTFVVYAFLHLLCPLASLKKGYVVEANEARKNYFHAVKVDSLLPPDVCEQSIEAPKKGSSLKVVNKHGPCFQVNGFNEASKVPSAGDIILQDRLRVNSIRARLSKNSTSSVFEEMQSTLPASTNRGSSYVVTVGLGTPKRDFTLAFDTGSDLTWTQCEPCLGGCFQQDEPKFDPAKSTSYKNLSCSSAPCKQVSEESSQGCSSTKTCLYGIQYGSGYTIGFLATETITISSSAVFKNFVIGCGERNAGTFSGVSGLLGLGRSTLSFISQTTGRYKNIFSYCLPSSASRTGFLSFGSKASRNAKFTPLSNIQNVFYGLDVVGISVGGRRLPIDTSIFTKAGTIIDSGTTLTYLPSTAFSALSSTFEKLMTGYPLVKGSIGLKPCYDLSNYANRDISLPAISVLFKGSVEVDVDVSGILIFVKGLKEVCLGFDDAGGDDGIGIFGNLQQKTYEVVYDVAKGVLGFAPDGCK